jgi:protein dithiol:quinone oxidoreductase
MNNITYRQIQFFLCAVSFFVFFASLYFQYIVGLIPCPLCLMQRLCVFLLFILMGVSIGSVKRANLASILQIVFSIAGLYFSMRQLWIQSLPTESIPACMPGLDVLLQYFPWQTIAQALFWGGGDCAEVTWSMLGISMAGWCAMYFMFMLLTGIYLFFNHPRYSNYWQ